MRMATFARYKSGQITEEILFWDKTEWMRQLGIELEMKKDKQ
jgi:hypothetical protein